MMKILIGCLLTVVLVSCQFKQTEKTTLSDEKLARIMADLNIAEAATIGLAGYPKDSLMKVYFNQVFEIHGTTPEEYEKDIRIVAADLKKLQQIILASTKMLDSVDPKPVQ
jgi:hypothetical protein